MTREEQAKKMQQIVAKAWSDEEFKKRLLTDPKTTLQQEGVDIPTGLDVRIVENTDQVGYFVLPPKPTGQELSDDDLDKIAGGGQACLYTYCSCF